MIFPILPLTSCSYGPMKQDRVAGGKAIVFTC